jgi:hypothetical protein
MIFKVVITPDTEDGGFTVSCPALPGCHSQGETMRGAGQYQGCHIRLYRCPQRTCPNAAGKHGYRRVSTNMSGLPVISGKKSVKTFHKFGFSASRQTSSHVIMEKTGLEVTLFSPTS